MQMFQSCSSLETPPPLKNLKKVKDTFAMFQLCSSLKTVPLYDLDTVDTVQGMFNNCRNVESGTYALFMKLNSQTPPPSTYRWCFQNCGVNTTTGQAELQQIIDAGGQWWTK